MAIAIDGNVYVHGASGTAIELPALSTAGTNRIIVVMALYNSAGVISSITGGGLSFSLRKHQSPNGTHVDEWYAVAASALDSVVLTINLSENATYLSANAFGLSGADTSTVYDGNEALPDGADTGHTEITTSNANDILIAMYRFGIAVNPTAGTGWTTIRRATYFLVQYKLVSATQSALDVPIGDHDGSENGGIADAIMAAGEGGAEPFTHLIHQMHGGTMTGGLTE